MSRLAVVSDIHGNRVAFEQVLRALDRRAVDAVLCLGDIVGYGPEPSECVALVRRTCRLSIRGNHEDGLLSGSLDRSWNPIARAGLAYARRVMSPEDASFLRELPASFSIARVVHAVHDSPVPSDDGMDYLRDVEAASQAFRWVEEPVCLVGHTHVPACFTTDRKASDARIDPSEVMDLSPGRPRPARGTCDPEAPIGSLGFEVVPEIVELREGSRCIVNPGSVGQPRDRDPRASFAILDLARGCVEFHRVAYDVAEAMRRAARAGLPGILGERLAVGA